MPEQMTPRPQQPVPAAPPPLQPRDILHPKPSALRAITGTDHSGLSDQILNAVAAALWLPEGSDHAARAEAAAGAMAAVHGFAPRDPVEGMMAAQAVALHHAAMACFGRAMLPSQSAEVMERLHRQGASLCRAMAEMAEAIDRRRGKGPQIVRVERVVVQDGGQAIVGAVTQRPAEHAPGGGADDPR